MENIKSRLNDEGAQSVTLCNKLKIPAKDGKMRKTDVVTVKQLLRIIQSINSPNAELLRKGYDVTVGKIGNFEIDFMSVGRNY